MARIAHAGILHETNTFAPRKAEWADFVRAEGFPGLTLGQAMLEVFPAMNIATGGFINEARALGHELAPIAWCAAVPSAHVTEDALDSFTAILLDGLADAGAIDAVYLDLHGAMVCEHLEDGEGELLRRVRAEIGDELPLVVSLDLHSNTTPEMLELSDGLVAYRTYPHLDMADTGARAARYLDAILRDEGTKPFKARRAVPFLMPLTGQCTMQEPTKGTYEFLEELEQAEGVRLMSYTPGFPPADIWHCGPVVLAYGDSQTAADTAAEALYAHILAREEHYAVPMLAPGEAVARAIKSNAHRPFVLADVQDNSGAGGTSDTTGLLRALVEQKADRATVGVLVDPEAAAEAHAAGLGAEIEIGVGGKLFAPGGPPLRARYKVTGLSDGRFHCTGPFYKGVNAQLGPCAMLTTGGVSVIVSTNRMQAADKEMFRHLGCEPAEQKILGLKSSVHFRGDFTDIAEEILVVESPGANIERPENLAYENLRPGVRLRPKGEEWKG